MELASPLSSRFRQNALNKRDLAQANYARNPLDAENLTIWGRALLQLSRFENGQDAKRMIEDAISKLEEALGIYPLKDETLFLQGKCFTALTAHDPNEAKGYLRKALACFQKASHEDPFNEIYFRSVELVNKELEMNKDIRHTIAKMDKGILTLELTGKFTGPASSEAKDPEMDKERHTKAEMDKDIHTKTETDKGIYNSKEMDKKNIQTNEEMDNKDIHTNKEMDKKNIQTNEEMDNKDFHTNKEMDKKNIQTNEEMDNKNIHTNTEMDMDIHTGEEMNKDIHTNTEMDKDIHTKEMNKENIQTNEEMDNKNIHTNAEMDMDIHNSEEMDKDIHTNTEMDKENIHPNAEMDMDIQTNAEMDKGIHTNASDQQFIDAASSKVKSSEESSNLKK